MIIKELKGSAESAYLTIPDDADDLFILRRIIEKQDHVVANTTRLIKQVKEYSRPDKGERVRVRITLRVDNVSLDSLVDKLRIVGVITNTDNELVSRGSHHSLTIQIGEPLTIDKGRKWRQEELSILRKSTDSSRTSNFILVGVDTREAAIAKLSGTHLHVVPNIYSGQSGKRYQHAVKSNPDIFFGDIAQTLKNIDTLRSAYNFDNSSSNSNNVILIFGPGETKRRFYNFLLTEKQGFEKKRLSIIEGIDVAGEDGILVFLRSPSMKQVMSSSKLAAVSAILDEVIRLVYRSESKYAMGMKEVSNAAEMKAIERLVFSDSIFANTTENDLIHLLNKVEGHGAKTYAVDSSTDIGLRISSLGGIVALLRYAVR
jgi:protein pelota